MRSRAELKKGFLVFIGTLNFVTFITVAADDVLPYVMDLPPRTPPQVLATPPYQDPELDHAYMEVMTPYYHYYFYAPRFKASFLKHLFEDSTPYSQWYPTRNNFYSPQSYENEYDKFNDVGFPNYEGPSQRNFLENRHRHFHQNDFSHSQQNPSVSSFLPTALSSSTPNIIRSEKDGRTLLSNVFKHAYVPGYKDHKHTELNGIFQTKLNPSLHSSGGPNIIRDEGFSVNKLFTPVTPEYYGTNLTYYSFTSKPPLSYHTVSSTLGPSTHRSIFPDSALKTPSTLRTIFPESVQETLSPIFTSGPPPVQGFTTASPLPQGSFPNHEPVATERPPVLFEAPGHTVPRR